MIKLFERVVTEALVEYMEVAGLFNARQHIFQASRSCLSQLLKHYQILLNIMETGSSADVFYLNFAKAFDKVDHAILKKKLKTIGAGGVLFYWIH